jgi:hypothetical protein
MTKQVIQLEMSDSSQDDPDYRTTRKVHLVTAPACIFTYTIFQGKRRKVSDDRAGQRPSVIPSVSLSLSPLLDSVSSDSIAVDSAFDDLIEDLLPEYLHVRKAIQLKESEMDENVRTSVFHRYTRSRCALGPKIQNSDSLRGLYYDRQTLYWEFIRAVA